MDYFDLFEAPKGNYEITGPDSQILSFTLKPGEKVDAEPGSMMFMSQDISIATKMVGCCRCCAGESCCKVIFENSGNEDAVLGLTPNYPSKVVPVYLPSTNNSLIVQQGSYIASTGDVEISANADFNCCRCCCAGFGFIRQKLSGTGTVFLAAGGTIITKMLAPGETILVDETSVVGFAETATLGIRSTGGCCNCACGGK